MADRRTDDTPLAPRRPLGASGGSTEGARGTGRADEVTGGRQRERGGPRQSAPAPSPGRASGNRGAPQATQPVRRPGGTGRPDRPGRTDDRPAPRTSTTQRTTSSKPRTRKARLRLTHLDPWSVMKTSFLLSIAFGIVTVIAVAVVWSVLGAAGVWESINRTVQDVIGGETGSSFDVENYVGTSRVMGFTMIVAVVDVILITAIATLGAFLYNLAATLLGGVEVTLAEDER